MTILLAIETSTEVASVALYTELGIICRELSGVQTHSQGILPAIRELLNEGHVSLSQCDGIAYGCGPGAFTGVRTACGIVQGLAFGADLPILPVVSLLAMAQAVPDPQTHGDYVCVLDARMGELYWAHYRYHENAWQQLSQPALSTADQLRDYLDLHKVALVLGNGVVLDVESSITIHHKMPHAQHVVQLALHDYVNGKQLTADQAQPLYLRNKIALTTAERAALRPH